MDAADKVRLAALEATCREMMDRNKVLWIRVAQAQLHEDNYLWLRDVWWNRREPRELTEYGPDELDDAIAAYRAGKVPKPSRRSKFDEWVPPNPRGSD